MASMNNFYSDMSNSTNTVLYFNEKGDIAHNLYDAGWLFYLSQPNRWRNG